MLGVGLHSYGFMDAAVFWLVGFVLSQVRPDRRLRSPFNRSQPTPPAPTPRRRTPAAAQT